MNTEHKSDTPKEIRDLWQTPKFVFEHFDCRLAFNMDVAASATNALCSRFLTAEDDALNSEWSTRNWCNPPYSKIKPWVKKAIVEMEKGKLTAMLLPSDTSVEWFSMAFLACTECHFISGRLSFINAEAQKPVNGNNKGSVVFIFDPKSPVKQSVHLINRDDMK